MQNKKTTIIIFALILLVFGIFSIYYMKQLKKINDTKINILTRSGKRKECFSILRESIEQQTHTNYKHIISNDNKDNDFLKKYDNVVSVDYIEKDKVKYIDTHAHCPYNLYLNTLIDKTSDGWNIIIDDDAVLIDKNFLRNLAKECSKAKKDEILVYNIFIGRSKEKSPVQFDKQLKHGIIKGHIDMNSFVFHSSCTIRHDDKCAGDYNFIKNAQKNGYKLKYIKKPQGVWSNYNGWSFGQHVTCKKPVEAN